MTAIERDNTAVTRGPLFVIAGSHASLHWCVTILFVLLPFIKDELSLDYTQTGFLVTVVQLAAFVANIPSGIIVDVTGRRTACKLVSLTVCGLGLAGLGFAQGYWALATCVAIISITNTLWHPAAIAFLSEAYADRRGLTLSFHTIGASLGDAAAPTVAMTAQADSATRSTSSTVLIVRLVVTRPNRTGSAYLLLVLASSYRSISSYMLEGSRECSISDRLGWLWFAGSTLARCTMVR